MSPRVVALASALALCTASPVRAQPAQIPGAPNVVKPAELRLLDARNVPTDPTTGALGISRSITNNGTLPTGFDYDARSSDEADVRIELNDDAADGDEVWLTIESLDGATSKPRSVQRLQAKRPHAGQPFRSRFLRLVGDAVDLHAPSVEAQTLLVALRDRVRVTYESARGKVEQTWRVGAPGVSDGPRAARRAQLHVHVLRSEADGPPVAGNDANGALALLRMQVLVANQVWLQCSITFGDPNELAIDVVSPPPPSLIAIGDADGLLARGGGVVRFIADDVAIGPITTRSMATPHETADEIARALGAAGFSPRVSENPRTRFGAGPSADVLVLRRDGSPAVLRAQGDAPLGSDSRQSVQLGVVDLLDGLSEFDNMNAQAGTLEERALVKALMDDDPATIDLFIVNRFSEATRQGEAFIDNAGGPPAAIVNTVILDRQGLRHLPLAWTLAHEVGHVLLGDPLHPDNIGPDRPWLLMDADNSRGTVNGPKRLRAEDCARVRRRAAQANPPLLVPYDVEPLTPFSAPPITRSK